MRCETGLNQTELLKLIEELEEINSTQADMITKLSRTIRMLSADDEQGGKTDGGIYRGTAGRRDPHIRAVFNNQVRQ